MPYSTSTQVLALVDSDMTSAEVDEIILRVDERIKLKIDVTLVNALVLEDLSSLWSAYRVMIKDPNARSLGEYSERRDTALAAMKAEIDDIVGVLPSGIISGVKLVATMEPL